MVFLNLELNIYFGSLAFQIINFKSLKIHEIQFWSQILFYLRSKLPTDTILFVIQSVTTDDKFPSVVTDWITDEKVSVVKKRRVATWRFWQVIFSDGITDGFKKTARTATWTVRRLNCRRNHRGIWNGRSVRWHVDCSVKITDGSPIEVPSVKPSGKVNICPLCRPSPPLFLLLLPNPNSPHL